MRRTLITRTIVVRQFNLRDKAADVSKPLSSTRDGPLPVGMVSAGSSTSWCGRENNGSPQIPFGLLKNALQWSIVGEPQYHAGYL